MWESGAVPEVLLTKADLVADAPVAVARTREVAAGVAVRAVSNADPRSVDALRSALRPGTTVALLGPSGAGKSTLVNLLAGVGRAATAATAAEARTKLLDSPGSAWRIGRSCVHPARAHRTPPGGSP